MAPKHDPEALKALDTLVQTAKTLLDQLHHVLTKIHRDDSPSNTSASSASTTSSTPPPLDALALARDASALIRAHSTKISLLIINEPFTPSAVTTVLRDLVGQPIPALASSVQACDPQRYTRLVQKELAWRCMQVLAEARALVDKIPLDGKVVAEDKRQGASAAEGRGSITSTGMLWSACDGVTKLGNMGVAGFFVKKTEEWKDTLKDVMEEMKEWGDEEPDDDEDEDEDEDKDEGSDGGGSEDGVDDLVDQMGGSHISTQAMLDDLMNSSRAIPRSDPDRIRPRLESSLKRIRLVILLYQAIIKRRIKKLPSSSLSTTPNTTTTTTIPARLDEAAHILRKLPDAFGDLACAFYELQPVEIDAAMDQCFFDAFAASEMLGRAWDGGADEFTEWTGKFQVEIKKET
jgi:hypothetical protein